MTLRFYLCKSKFQIKCEVNSTAAATTAPPAISTECEPFYCPLHTTLALYTSYSVMWYLSFISVAANANANISLVAFRSNNNSNHNNKFLQLQKSNEHCTHAHRHTQIIIQIWGRTLSTVVHIFTSGAILLDRSTNGSNRSSSRSNANTQSENVLWTSLFSWAYFQFNVLHILPMPSTQHTQIYIYISMYVRFGRIALVIIFIALQNSILHSILRYVVSKCVGR